MDEKRKTTLYTIESDGNPLFNERESGEIQTPFKEEFRLFSAIRDGNVNLVKDLSDTYINKGFNIGKMSHNELRQIKYWAVSTIAVAIHYAILGGLDQTDAFNLSDEYIRYIDTATSQDDIVTYLYDKAMDLTYHVYHSKYMESLSPPIRKTIHYIHVNLHKKLNIGDLALQCNLSRDYLSTLFKKETGESLHRYILKEKLKLSQTYLLEGVPYSEIAYRLSFCSETHFIQAFKKEFGETPGHFIDSLKGME